MRVYVSGTVTHRWTAEIEVPVYVAEKWFEAFDTGDTDLDLEIFENWIDPRDHYDEGTRIELDDINTGVG